MAQNVQEIWQTDFNGGVVDAIPSDQIEENQCATLSNLMPLRDGRNLTVRGGVTLTAATVGADNTRILGAMSKRLTNGAEVMVYAVGVGTVGSQRLDIVITHQDGANYVASTINCAALVSGASRNFADLIDGVWFSNWDGNRFFFSDDYTGLYTVDINTGTVSSSTVALVKNKNHKTGDSDTDAPMGRGLVQHRGRLWLYKNDLSTGISTVYFCGTDDSHSYKRWENWLPWNDPSVITETIIDDGNSMSISPRGTQITGLASTYDGLVVFKERSISLWTYPDSAAPWEVLEGANIEVMSTEVGAVGSHSIVRVGDIIYFLAYDSGERLSLFTLTGSTVSNLGLNIPQRFETLRQFTDIWMAPLGDYIYIMCEDGMKLAFNMLHDSFYDLDSDPLAAPIAVGDKIWLVWANGKNATFPTGNTDNGDAIPYSLETRHWKPKGWYGEFKGRMIWCEFGSVDAGNISYVLKWDSARPTVADGDFDSAGTFTPTYNSGLMYNSGQIFGGTNGIARMMKAVIGGRGRSLAFGFNGTASSETYINRVGLGYRGRSGKT